MLDSFGLWRIDPFTCIVDSVGFVSSINPSLDSCIDSIRDLVLMMRLLPLRDDALLLLPDNTTIFPSSNQYNLPLLRRLVLDIVLAPILMACSCRRRYRCCCCCSSCIMSCRLDTRGFLIRVGLGTKCTQYLFRDHFFLANTQYDLCSSRRCCSSTAISSVPSPLSIRSCCCLLSYRLVVATRYLALASVFEFKLTQVATCSK